MNDLKSGFDLHPERMNIFDITFKNPTQKLDNLKSLSEFTSTHEQQVDALMLDRKMIQINGGVPDPYIDKLLVKIAIAGDIALPQHVLDAHAKAQNLAVESTVKTLKIAEAVDRQPNLGTPWASGHVKEQEPVYAYGRQLTDQLNNRRLGGGVSDLAAYHREGEKLGVKFDPTDDYAQFHANSSANASKGTAKNDLSKNDSAAKPNPYAAGKSGGQVGVAESTQKVAGRRLSM